MNELAPLYRKAVPAQAALRLAETKEARTRSLVGKGFISQAELDTAPQYDPSFVPGGVALDPDSPEGAALDADASGPRLEPRVAPGLGLAPG